jgi:hypoxanthine phosphoribosyltransferase
MHFMGNVQHVEQALRVNGATRAGDSHDDSHDAIIPETNTQTQAFRKFAADAFIPLLGFGLPREGSAGIVLSAGMTTRRKLTTRSSQKPPVRWRAELDCVLISPALLRRRVKELARRIEADYNGRELVIVPLLTGTVLFLADLIRYINIPLRLDFVGVSSYREGTISRELVFTKELRLDVKGRDVLVVDDILDTGRTLGAVMSRLKKLKPASISTCVLLDKPARRKINLHADYVGFEIPDLFVVGYGLDFAERYRNLPFVGVLHPKLYPSA